MPESPEEYQQKLKAYQEKKGKELQQQLVVKEEQASEEDEELDAALTASREDHNPWKPDSENPEASGSGGPSDDKGSQGGSIGH